MYGDVETMMTLEDLAKACSWKIAGGTEYLWESYGKNCRFIDFKDNTWQVSAVFNTDDHTLREVTGYGIPHSEKQPWRWIDPEFGKAYIAECKSLNKSSSEAWDGCRFVTVLNIVDVYVIIDNMKDNPNE